MPPYSPIFGHLPVVAKIMSKLPRDSHNQYLPGLLREAHPGLGPNFYMDTWPFGSPVLFICEPSALHQITQEHSLPKHPDLKEFLRPLANGQDIVTMEGQTWKTWRHIFNPGFTFAHLMTLTPVIVEETLVLCDILKARAKTREVFPMKERIDKFTMDVIGNVVLDTHLNTQRSENTMVNALKRQIRWLVFGSKMNPWERWHPLRRLVHWCCTRQMDEYLYPELDRQISKVQEPNSTPSKSIISLVLHTYLAENPSRSTVDSTFKTFAVSQVKQFLFSGHDTTSSTICYIFYLLSSHPEILSRVEAEHTQVFGQTLTEKLEKLKEESHLLNRLPYTVAVLKETMRLFPVASTLRGGEAEFYVRGSEGQAFPTNGFLVWGVSQPLHRDADYWPQADKFIPDRWLVGPEDPLYPIKGAWRPFEYGPRNCIGQELAMIEMKVAMIVILHLFDVEIAYEDIDRLKPRSPCMVSGERAYQLTLAGPSDGLPVRLKEKVSVEKSE
ncbi:MAG: hypothetical protein Q9213_005889 [Squamulea squamosa]